MRELTGDDTISFREGGIVSIGGEGGIILGGTDARAYAEPVATGVPPKANPPGTRSVMDCMADEGDFTVHGDYDTTFFTSLGMQPKKFYRLQVLRSADGFGVAMNYGRQGEPGKADFFRAPDEADAIKQFEKKFRSKTGNNWGNSPFVPHPGKYELFETDEGGGGGDTASGGALA